MFEGHEIIKSITSLVRELPQNIRHKYLKADISVDTIADLDIKEVKSYGVTTLYIDMDNTLTTHAGKKVHPTLFKTLHNLCKHFEVIVFSNGNEARVQKFLKNNSEYDMVCAIRAEGLKKPDTRAFKAVLANHKSDPKKCAMIGDRYLTDVCGAKKAGFKLAIKVKPFNVTTEPKFLQFARRVEDVYVNLF